MGSEKKVKRKGIEMDIAKIIDDWERTLDSLRKFSDIADELGLEMTVYQKGIIKGHIRRLEMEMKEYSQREASNATN